MSIKSMLLAAAIAVAGTTASADAAVINLDTLSGWDIQDQLGVLGNFYDNTYTTTSGSTVKVTDLYYWGDEYAYYIDGNLIGNILVPGAPAAFDADPDSAYSGGLFAHATFHLAAGSVLSFKALTLPEGFDDGTIAVSAGTVPEAATWAMMITGFGLVGVSARRRRTVAA